MFLFPSLPHAPMSVRLEYPSILLCSLSIVSRCVRRWVQYRQQTFRADTDASLRDIPGRCLHGSRKRVHPDIIYRRRTRIMERRLVCRSWRRTSSCGPLRHLGGGQRAHGWKRSWESVAGNMCVFSTCSRGLSSYPFPSRGRCICNDGGRRTHEPIRR